MTCASGVPLRALTNASRCRGSPVPASTSVGRCPGISQVQLPVPVIGPGLKAWTGIGCTSPLCCKDALPVNLSSAGYVAGAEEPQHLHVSLTFVHGSGVNGQARCNLPPSSSPHRCL